MAKCACSRGHPYINASIANPSRPCLFQCCMAVAVTTILTAGGTVGKLLPILAINDILSLLQSTELYIGINILYYIIGTLQVNSSMNM